ncbi:MAG TPA: hypothetical protein VH593_16075, partial [Ktedonobacteraceae bacterium]
TGSGSESKIYKTRADAFFVATADGVWLSNNYGSFSLKGKSSYPLIKFIFSSLDGKKTVEAVCAGLELDKRRVIEHLIETLEQRGFLKHVPQPPEDVPLWAQQLYGDQIDFIDQYANLPFARFMTFRQKHVLCIGRGAALRGLIVALVEAGAGHVEVRPINLSPEDEIELTQLTTAATERDPDLQLHICFESSSTTAIHEILSTTEQPDCILFASDEECSTEMGDLCRQATQANLVFGAVSLIGDHLVTSPLFTTASNVCWECMYRSLFLPHVPNQTAVRPLAPAPTALACYQLVHNLFCHYTEILQDGEVRCTIVDCDTLVAKTHRIFPHPLCSSLSSNNVTPQQILLEQLKSDEPMRPDLPTPEDPSELVQVQDSIVARTAHWTDAMTGPLLYVGEDDLSQVPFATSKCVVRSVHHTPTTINSHTFICQGLSARETRNQVVLLGLERIARDLAQKTLPAISIGAGWSPYESIYRALSNASLSWNAEPDRSISSQTIEIAQVKEMRLGGYICEILGSLACPDPQVTIETAPTGFFVATARSEQAITGYGTGLSETQASLNALMGLASRLAPSQEAAREDEVYPVHFLQDLQSWKDALSIAEMLHRDQGTNVSYWDLSDLIPFASQRCYITGVRLERGTTHV